MERTSDTLIMLFTRNPVLGRVKTRIGMIMGDVVALETHIRLCVHTRQVTCRVDCDRMLWLDDVPEGEWLWGEGQFKVFIQQGANLGERMSMAFRYGFDVGYRKVVIIGTDCPGLTSDLLNETISRLGDFPAVIGPAADGGYYLLGLTAYIPELFTGKNWGSDEIFGATIKDLQSQGISYFSLPVLPDVDTPADLIHLAGIP